MVASTDGTVAALFAAQHGAATRRQLAGSGVSRKAVAARLRAGLFAEPVPGVVVLASVPATWLQALTVATLAGGGAVASHRSAARLHRLDGFLGEPTIEVSVVRGRRLCLPGVAVHEVQRLDATDMIVVGGVAATGLARTLADLGSVCSSDAVLRALDDAGRRGVSRRWLRETAERLHRPGQRGTGVLLDLLAEAGRDGRLPESWFERLVERCLRDPSLPPVVRQHEVRDQRGRFVARLDLAMPSIRLGIEAHSRRFHAGLRPERADEDRDLRLAAEGWEVLYVGWQHTRRPAALLDVVRRAAAGRAPG